MKTRQIIAWGVLLFLALTPVLLLFFLGEQGSFTGDYESATHIIGEILGLVGMTLFALTFVLSTRIKFIEEQFGGLDKVYIVHGVLGGTALITILFHPIFLVLKFIPSNLTQAALYLLPSNYWSVNFGILALLGLIFLTVLTLFSKMKYHTWKFTHEFMGLVFLFAVLHTFLVRGEASKDLIFQGYYIYAAVVSAIGLLSFSYSLFLKERIFKNAVYKIKSITQHPSAFELLLQPEHKPIAYHPGQFIFVRFYNEKLSKEAHPFSLASTPSTTEIKIIVKKLGDFTSKLEHLQIGDKVSVEGPYGKFNYLSAQYKNQVWIAAGIGVVPFLGMAEDILERKKDHTIQMFYSASEDKDFIGMDTFRAVAHAVNSFHFTPWNSKKRGYLTGEALLPLIGNTKEKDYFLCGPAKFKESIIKTLVHEGVKKDHIHEEVFDFR